MLTVREQCRRSLQNNLHSVALGGNSDPTIHKVKHITMTTRTTVNLLGSPAAQVSPSLQVFPCDPDRHNTTSIISILFTKIMNQLPDLWWPRIRSLLYYIPLLFDHFNLISLSKHTTHPHIPYVWRIERPTVRETGSRLTPYHRPRFTWWSRGARCPSVPLRNNRETSHEERFQDIWECTGAFYWPLI